MSREPEVRNHIESEHKPYIEIFSA